MNETPDLTPEELDEQRTDLLPDREALSLLLTDPAAYTAGLDEFGPAGPGASAGTGAADAASGTATDAAASGSAEEW